MRTNCRFQKGDYVVTKQPIPDRIYEVLTIMEGTNGGYWLVNTATGIARDDVDSALEAAGVCAECEGPCLPDDYLCAKCRC